MPERTYPWLGLRFQYTRTGELAVRWRDDRRANWSALPEHGAAVTRPLPPDLAGIAPALLVPLDLPALGAARKEAPLAVFVDAALPLRGLPLERLAAWAIGTTRGAATFARWMRRRMTSPPLFRLPLRVVAVGSRWQPLAARLAAQPWLLGDPNVPEYGFRLEVIEPDALSARLSQLAPRVDIVLTGDGDVRAVLRSRRPPRVVGVFGEPASMHVWATTLAVPAGCSLIRVPALGPDAEVDLGKELIYAFIHDMPAHAAVQELAAKAGLDPAALLVLTDPIANQSLRIGDAVAPALAEIERLTREVDPGGYGALIARLDPADSLLFEESSAALGDRPAEFERVLGGIDVISWDFQHESKGLAPLALARAATRAAAHALGGARGVLDDVVRDPRRVEILRKHQRRSVDLTLHRLEASPITQFTTEPPPAPLPIRRATVLRAGARYLLKVQIGKPSRDSLLEEPPPSLDPLLPDPPDARGHELEIVVHGHDFEVLSKDRRLVYLPLLGGARPVDFDLRAPPLDGAPAALPRRVSARIAVHYRGNLLQSFLLQAQIAAEEGWAPDDPLRATLEFSQSERLSNLDDLGPRRFCIGANETVAGSHRLTFLSTDEKAELPLTDAQIDDAIKQFRATLEEATFSGKDVQRFDLAKPPAWPEFGTYMRRLARDGAALHRLLLQTSVDVQPVLESIGDSHDETLQIALYNPSFSFPWAGVYDREVPDTDTEICLGGATPDELAHGAPLEFRCGHRYDDEAFCVFGFWGVRQRLELRLPKAGEPIAEIPAGAAAEPIHLAVGALDRFTQGLVDDLTTALGPRVRVIAEEEDVVKILWGQERPAELILVGHLQARQRADPRIVFSGAAEPLRASALTRRLKRGAWKEQPNPLVLLMACGSAGTDLRSLVTLLQTFTMARAGAVIGTETPVMKSLVSRFAVDLTTSMWRSPAGMPLAAAMTHARRQLIANGNPLGFGFSAYGNADLAIRAVGA